MNVRFHPEAEKDIACAMAYYRQKATTVIQKATTVISRALLREIEKAVSLLEKHPMLGASWTTNIHRLVLRRFPHAIVYSIDIPIALQKLGTIWRKRRRSPLLPLVGRRLRSASGKTLSQLFKCEEYT